LREVDLHEWEGLYKQQIKDQWPDLYRHWRGESPGKFRVASGKYPIRDLWARAGVVWQQLLQEAESEGGAESLAKIGTKRSLVIGHNGINQALLATALGLSEEAFRKFEFPNCGLVELVWNPGEPRAKLWRRVYPKPTAWEVVAEGQGELGSAVSDTEVDDESDASLSSLASPCTD
jgi:probable phosphoglycerate mutase